jgi:hypothetical protein
VLQDLHADEAALEVHADQRHHRLAGIGRRVGDVGGQHHVPQQCGLALRVLAVSLHVGRLALALGERLRAREHLGAGDQVAQPPRGVEVLRQLGFVGVGPGEPRDEQCGSQRPQAHEIREQGHGTAGAPRAGRGARARRYASTIMRVRISRWSAWQKCVQ